MIERQGYYWGVDSVSPVYAGRTMGLRGLPRNRTIFEHVCRYVQPPAFWGRYLNRRRSRITPHEVERLKEFIGQVRNGSYPPGNLPWPRSSYTCKILPIYNRWSSHPDRYVGRGARRNGLNDAEDAANRAALAGIPQGVCIYVDVERDRVSRAYFEGWFEGMYASKYYGVGGVYGNAGLHTFTTGRLHERQWSSTIDDAFAAVEQGILQSWHSDPGAFSRRYDWVSDQTIDVSRTKQIETLIYTNRPRGGRYYIYLNGDAPRGQEIYRNGFDGSIPEGLPPENTVVWQYAGNMFLGTGGRMVDYNIARPKAYDVMWDPMS